MLRAGSLSALAARPQSRAEPTNTASGNDIGLPDTAAVRPEIVRTFGEPLLPVGTPAPGETERLAEALEEFRSARDVEAIEPILGFLAKYPDSAWKPSLLANLSVLYRHTGYIDRAVEAAGEAWNLTKRSSDSGAKQIAQTALATLVDLTSALGRTDDLAALLGEVGSRPLTGHAAEVISNARSGLWLIDRKST